MGHRPMVQVTRLALWCGRHVAPSPLVNHAARTDPDRPGRSERRGRRLADVAALRRRRPSRPRSLRPDAGPPRRPRDRDDPDAVAVGHASARVRRRPPIRTAPVAEPGRAAHLPPSTASRGPGRRRTRQPQRDAAPARSLDARLARLRAKYGIPGISAAILFADGSIWRGTRRRCATWPPGVPVTPDTSFSVASVSKTFTVRPHPRPRRGRPPVARRCRPRATCRRCRSIRASPSANCSTTRAACATSTSGPASTTPC